MDLFSVLFLSLFIAILGTIVLMVPCALVFSIPYAKARKQALVRYTGSFLTEQQIEREIAIHNPTLYKFKQYAEFIETLVFVAIFAISVAVFIFGHLT